MLYNDRMKKNDLTSLVLLAGNSTRMGRPKQHLLLGNQTFLQLIISKLEAFAEITRMLFVGQAGDTDGQNEVAKHNGIWVNNPMPEQGPLSSIRLALPAIAEDSAILLWPVDHPMIGKETVRRIISEWQKQPEMITVPSDGKKRGHPVIFPAWCRPLFKEIPLTDGARSILQMNPQRINHVLSDDFWITRNLNTPEAFSEAENWLKLQAPARQSAE